MLIKFERDNLSEVLKKAVAVIKDDGIVAFPTETFYGLGVKFDNEASLRKLYELKKRHKEKPMPLIIGGRTLLSMIAVSVNETAESLMDKFWPGPLTLLLNAKKDLSSYLTAGTDRVAVRIPGESFALHLAREAGFPITATSANPSGMPPAEDADSVIRYFGGEIDMVIDGGRTPGGLPSTIADVTEKKIKIVREGAILRRLLEI
jgi:L-threonylcarbamoyladenylate synthase